MKPNHTAATKKTPFVKIVTKDGAEFQGELFQINKQNKTISLKIFKKTQGKGPNSKIQEEMLVFKSSNIKDLKVFKVRPEPKEDKEEETQQANEGREDEGAKENEGLAQDAPKKAVDNKPKQREQQNEDRLEDSRNKSRERDPEPAKRKWQKGPNQKRNRRHREDREFEDSDEDSEEEMDLEHFQEQTEKGDIERTRNEGGSNLPKFEYNKEDFFDNITLEDRSDRRNNKYGRNRTNQETFDMTRQEVQESVKEQRKFMRRGRGRRGRRYNNPRNRNQQDNRYRDDHTSYGGRRERNRDTQWKKKSRRQEPKNESKDPKAEEVHSGKEEGKAEVSKSESQNGQHTEHKKNDHRNIQDYDNKGSEWDEQGRDYKESRGDRVRHSKRNRDRRQYHDRSWENEDYYYHKKQRNEREEYVYVKKEPPNQK